MCEGGRRRGEPRTWPVAADRSARLRNIDLEHAAKELGVVHVVDGVGGVSPILKLDECETAVLLCTHREKTRSATGARGTCLRGMRARVAASSTKFTSVISPKGKKAACRISVVTLSSSPPGGEVGCEPPTKGQRGARAHAPT